MGDKPFISQSPGKIQTAILLLPTDTGLYWQDVAGVPFLLRNILTLQAAGITRLGLWMEGRDTKADTQLHGLATDPRIDLTLDPAMDEITEGYGDGVLVLDGSTLLEKSDVLAEMTTIPESSNRCFSEFAFSPSSLGAQLESHGYYKAVPPRESARLTNPGDLHEAGESLLKSVGLSNDSMMDRMVTRSVSRQLTRFFLNTRLTPNQITFLSLLVGLGSALGFSQGTYFWGITGSLLLLVSAWIDCTDGEVARLKFMTSDWGAQFDVLCDNIVHVCVFFAIGLGLYFSTGDPFYMLYGGLAVLGTLISFALLSRIIVEQKRAAEQGKTLKASLTDQVANRDFTYFLLIMACIDRLDIFIILTALGANVFAGILIYKWLRTT